QFAAHYGLDLDHTAESPETAGVRVLADIAAARRLLTRHGEPDAARTAVLLLNDFREGKLGRLTIEWPDPP
ncbi:MAG: ribosome biogenesis GTPase YlqF, partial [SAR324 cluster bacterium]|nr:ribosome biogenesis GTPase YlqF [SAR324 cluster bacterium]